MILRMCSLGKVLSLSKLDLGDLEDDNELGLLPSMAYGAKY